MVCLNEWVSGCRWFVAATFFFLLFPARPLFRVIVGGRTQQTEKDRLIAVQAPYPPELS